MKMNLTPQQRHMFGQEMNNELEKITMSWSKELKEWHPIAIRALDFASIENLNIPASHYERLTETEACGINMNIISVLVNNIERRKPSEMRYNAFKWKEIISLNLFIAKSWEALVEPVRKKVLKRIELMEKIPPLNVIAKA